MGGPDAWRAGFRGFGYGLQKAIAPGIASGSSPFTCSTATWVPVASSATGKSIAELSGAQRRGLSAYWSKNVRNWSMKSCLARTTDSDRTSPEATSTNSSRTSVGVDDADGDAPAEAPAVA